MGHETLDLTSSNSNNNTVSSSHVQKSDFLKRFILTEAFLITWEFDYGLPNLVTPLEQKSV